jgi:H+-transporting ATPase
MRTNLVPSPLNLALQPSKEPEHWNLLEIFGTAIVLGAYLTISTIVLFHLAVYTDSFQRWFGLPALTAAEARGLIYLQVPRRTPYPCGRIRLD